MNTVLRLAVAGALTLGTYAANASIAAPSTGSSTMLLFAEVLNGNTVVASYGANTGVSVSAAYAGTNATFAATANLSALFAADVAGDTLVWAVEGGQYTGSNSSPQYAAGATTNVTTAVNPAQIPTKATAVLLSQNTVLGNTIAALNGNITSGVDVFGSAASTAGVWDANTPNGISAWGGISSTIVGAGTVKLYDLTGTGTATSKLATVSQGSVTLSASGLVFSPASAPLPVDSYDLGTHQLTMPTLTIGAATFSNTVVTVHGIITGPSGTSRNGTVDAYDPATKYLTVEAVTLSGTSNTFYNVVTDLTALDSIGSVTGADTYDGTYLTVANVQLGSTVYTNVVVPVSLSNIVKLEGGMPLAALDTYDPATGYLTIAAVSVGGRVYTNVVTTVGAIKSVGGSHPAAVTKQALGGRPRFEEFYRGTAFDLPVAL